MSELPSKVLALMSNLIANEIYSQISFLEINLIIVKEHL